MIKSYSRPSSPKWWYTFTIFRLIMVPILFGGTIVSVYMGYNALANLWSWATIALIASFGIEALGWLFSPLFFGSIADLFRCFMDKNNDGKPDNFNEPIKNFLMAVIAGTALYFIVQFNYEISLLGKETVVTSTYKAPDDVAVNTSISDEIESKAERTKATDLNNLPYTIRAEKAAEEKELQNKIFAAKKEESRLLNAHDYDSESGWFQQKIKSQRDIQKTAKAGIKALATKYKNLEDERKAAIQSNYTNTLNAASDTLVSYTTLANNSTQKQQKEHDKKVEKIQGAGTYLVGIGVYGALFASFMTNLFYLFSGRMPQYDEAENEFGTPLLAKFYNGIYYRLYGFLDGIIDTIIGSPPAPSPQANTQQQQPLYGSLTNPNPIGYNNHRQATQNPVSQVVTPPVTAQASQPVTPVPQASQPVTQEPSQVVTPPVTQRKIFSDTNETNNIKLNDSESLTLDELEKYVNYKKRLGNLKRDLWNKAGERKADFQAKLEIRRELASFINRIFIKTNTDLLCVINLDEKRVKYLKQD